jgi:O-antigen ligase
VGAVVLTTGVRPAIGGLTKGFDLALVTCVCVVALQLVPIAAPLRRTLSPHLDRAVSVLWLAPDGPAAFERAAPLSIDPGATRFALALVFGLVLVFWSARDIFSRGGIRVLARGIAAVGLLLALVALVQHTVSPTRLYGLYPTIFGTTFGPYVNRNDFATWLVMAVPVTIGYSLTRRASQSQPGRTAPYHPRPATEGLTVWLGASTCLMVAALFASLSRSGLLGSLAALACLLCLSRRRVDRAGRLLLIGGLLGAAVAVAYANVGALADRVGDTLASGIGGRRVIWRETWPMVRDFAATGVGAGAYERGMLIYQRTKGQFYFNQAHDEYLQLAAEGGVALAVPLIIALTGGIRLIGARLRSDHTPIFWIRAGAASGLLGVAVQSVWDTGLRMPANALLFALIAALALHPVREQTSPGSWPPGQTSGR